MSIDAIKELFNDVLKSEEGVLKIYNLILQETNDDYVKNVIRKISADERKHIKNAKEILEILET